MIYSKINEVISFAESFTEFIFLFEIHSSIDDIEYVLEQGEAGVEHVVWVALSVCPDDHVLKRETLDVLCQVNHVGGPFDLISIEGTAEHVEEWEHDLHVVGDRPDILLFLHESLVFPPLIDDEGWCAELKTGILAIITQEEGTCVA